MSDWTHQIVVKGRDSTSDLADDNEVVDMDLVCFVFAFQIRAPAPNVVYLLQTKTMSS